MEITVTSAIIFGAVQLAFTAGGVLLALGRRDAELKAMMIKLAELEKDFDNHRNNDDKHHNKAEFLRFEQNLSSRLRKMDEDSRDFRIEMTKKIDLLIESSIKSRQGG
jgi:hypothetical protein